MSEQRRALVTGAASGIGRAIAQRLVDDDVAETVAFLLTDAGRSITGSPVVMDMGWSAR